jgi:hypothetical protein
MMQLSSTHHPYIRSLRALLSTSVACNGETFLESLPRQLDASHSRYSTPRIETYTGIISPVKESALWQQEKNGQVEAQSN